MVKYVSTERRMDVINMAISGFSAFVRKAFKLTFNPSPIIAIVNIKEVKKDTPFIMLVGTVI